MNPSREWGRCHRCGTPCDVRSAYCGGDCAALELKKFRPPPRERLAEHEDEVAFWLAHGPECFGRTE